MQGSDKRSETTITEAHPLGMGATVDSAIHNMGPLLPLTTRQCHHKFRHANEAVRSWQYHLKQQQEEELPQQVRQHLVDFQGRTLCVSAFPKISCVLTAVLETLGVASEASGRIEVPWRITFGGRFLGLTEDAPSSGNILRVWTGGLKGGKGGFGAMLRAMAKQVTPQYRHSTRRWWSTGRKQEGSGILTSWKPDKRSISTEY